MEKHLDGNKVVVRIDCACGCDILDITYWADDKPRVYYLTLYKSSAGMGFWWRLRQAWRYFRFGEFEGNSIVLHEKEFDEFASVVSGWATDKNGRA